MVLENDSMLDLVGMEAGRGARGEPPGTGPAVKTVERQLPRLHIYALLATVFAGAASLLIVTWIQVRKLARLPHPFLDGAM
jgi:hypothetical protein